MYVLRSVQQARLYPAKDLDVRDMAQHSRVSTYKERRARLCRVREPPTGVCDICHAHRYLGLHVCMYVVSNMYMSTEYVRTPPLTCIKIDTSDSSTLTQSLALIIAHHQPPASITRGAHVTLELPLG